MTLLNVYPLKNGLNTSKKGYVLFVTNLDTCPLLIRKEDL
jgi:hypothetical protein